MGLGGRTGRRGGVVSDREGLEEIMTSDRILLLFFFFFLGGIRKVEQRACWRGDRLPENDRWIILR